MIKLFIILIYKLTIWLCHAPSPILILICRHDLIYCLFSNVYCKKCSMPTVSLYTWFRVICDNKNQLINVLNSGWINQKFVLNGISVTTVRSLTIRCIVLAQKNIRLAPYVKAICYMVRWGTIRSICTGLDTGIHCLTKYLQVECRSG